MAHPIFDLSGRSAVVVGGTSGIGLALAVGLAEAGADVVATSRHREQVDAAALQIEAKGVKAPRLVCDVRCRETLQLLLDDTLAALGQVDILVNCAGIIKRAPTVDFPEELWDSILDTNLTGTLRACQIFGRHMLDRGDGRIVNIASLNTFVSLKEVAAYAASKAAVGALTKSLAVEWSARGRARRLSHAVERSAAGWQRARPRAASANAARPLRPDRRAGGRCNLSGQ